MGGGGKRLDRRLSQRMRLDHRFSSWGKKLVHRVSLGEETGSQVLPEDEIGSLVLPR